MGWGLQCGDGGCKVAGELHISHGSWRRSTRVLHVNWRLNFQQDVCCILLHLKKYFVWIGMFFITGGSQVHFPQASPVPFCDVCNTQSKLQALVYDILSPTSAIIGYAFGWDRLYLCCIVQALINSIVCWFCRSALGFVLFQIHSLLYQRSWVLTLQYSFNLNRTQRCVIVPYMKQLHSHFLFICQGTFCNPLMATDFVLLELFCLVILFVCEKWSEMFILIVRQKAQSA